MVCRARKQKICPYVKLLGAQKMLCYGVSASAFVDYFQMGETTLGRCLSKLTQGMVYYDTLAKIYLQKPTESDARKIVDLHEKVQKIPGKMGSLDVTKVHWKTCPIAWKGQFQGQQKYAGLGLEPVVDNNLWFWHAGFGFPGTLNVINIWECSSLFESMVNGEKENLDFDFVVDGEVFLKLFTLSMAYTRLSHVSYHLNQTPHQNCIKFCKRPRSSLEGY